jgi:magnesium transporter
MATAQSETQQRLASSPSPATEFAGLDRDRQREVFFSLPESVRASVVADMDEEQLRGFV